MSTTPQNTFMLPGRGTISTEHRYTTQPSEAPIFKVIWASLSLPTSICNDTMVPMACLRKTSPMTVLFSMTFLRRSSAKSIVSALPSALHNATSPSADISITHAWLFISWRSCVAMSENRTCVGPTGPRIILPACGT